MHVKRSPRIMIAGFSPIFTEIDIPELVEEAGGIVVFDASCAGGRYPDNPPGNTNHRPTRKQNGAIFTKSTPSISHFSVVGDEPMIIVSLAQELSVDGLIFRILKGHAIHDPMLYRVEKRMKEKNIPLLRVETDYGSGNSETIELQIEAFTRNLSLESGKTGNF